MGAIERNNNKIIRILGILFLYFDFVTDILSIVEYRALEA
jgi:hypothetical protein